MAKCYNKGDIAWAARMAYGWSFVVLTPLAITSAIMVVRYQYVFENDSTTRALAVTNCALMLAVSVALFIGFVIAQCAKRACHTVLLCTFMFVIAPLATAAAICADILTNRIGMTQPQDPNERFNYPSDLPKPTPIPFDASPIEYYTWPAANAFISSFIVFGAMLICVIPGCCAICSDCRSETETNMAVAHVPPLPIVDMTTVTVTVAEQRSLNTFKSIGWTTGVVVHY